jgi:hypothetical protein
MRLAVSNELIKRRLREPHALRSLANKLSIGRAVGIELDEFLAIDVAKYE